SRPKEAMLAYEEAIAADQPAAYTLLRIAMCLQQLDRDQESITVLQRAITMDDSLAEGWAELAKITAFTGNLIDSISYVKKAIELEPDMVNFHAIALEVYLMTGLKLEATKAMESLMSCLDQDAEAFVIACSEVSEEGLDMAARALMEMGIIMHPKHVDVWALLIGYLKLVEEDSLSEEYRQRALVQFGNSLEEALESIYPGQG
ncbi:MAG: hypothetical protein MUQ40_05955, partial [Schleiferiaceae bacterium]|nr:hypothetical protein [Schleiferiaceae bacterium]